MSKSSYIAKLLIEGKTIEKYKEGGNSMMPIIKSNQPVTLVPIHSSDTLQVNDIVFCKVKGNYYTHLISGIRNRNGNIEYQISNNKGKVNGWIKKNNIFGKVIKIWK